MNMYLYSCFILYKTGIQVHVHPLILNYPVIVDIPHGKFKTVCQSNRHTYSKKFTSHSAAMSIELYVQ